ncbi:MAG: chemotaxis response regulator protein-glutamate methylesterase [Alphaproteobacteria bacterium]|nr:chemotaxis response regulator protein-glutamate methylesterase [Alphaproteobacteria bacterium]
MPITILLVDDSEVVRFLFTKSLERDPDLRVIATATNGLEAIEMAKNYQPDIILLDIEMPLMDGLTALPKILAVAHRSKVFIISGDSRSNARAAIESLELGASEFILKPGATGALNPQEFNEELRVKIKALIGPKERRAAPALPRPPANIRTAKSPASAPKTAPSLKKMAPVTALRPPLANAPARAETPAAPISLQPAKTTSVHALAIASSTGGPEALLRIFTDLNGQLQHIPIFITQHMPPVFTTALAEHITRHAGRLCREAVDGEKVAAGMIYLAPGGYHLLVRQTGQETTLALTQDPPVNSCRPSADPMFASISHAYGRNVLGLVLTGIGADGCQGARRIVENGGSVIAQDKASSVVYGMPRSVAEAGLCEAVVPLDRMADHLMRRCSLRG